MNPSEIKQILLTLGGGANKRLGQHFLIDGSALEAIVQAAALKKGDTVLEVGPGLGVLTEALLAKGVDVIAIEQDRRFIERLTQDRLRVVHGDAATVHWHELVGNTSWKFVSNLPYSITSLALRKALWSPKPPDVVVVLVQREVAERAIARNGKQSLLSLMVAFASEEARIVRRVASGSFYPPPKVESAVLRIVPMSQKDRLKKWGMEPEKIMEIAKKGFAHPRKLLSSNIGIKPEVLTEVGLNPKARSEDLSPLDWAKLARHLA